MEGAESGAVQRLRQEDQPERPKATMARRAPLASASQPQAAGAKMRVSGGSASTQAISIAPSPRQER